MTQLIDQLAPYQFFSAFPQLVSRICHAQPEVAQILQVGTVVTLPSHLIYWERGVCVWGGGGCKFVCCSNWEFLMGGGGGGVIVFVIPNWSFLLYLI